MPLDRRRKIALAAGATGLVAVGATAGYLLLQQERKGELLCPASPLFNASQLDKGDFVVLQLGTLDRSLVEPTWARVLGRTWFGLGSNVRVEIRSPLAETGEPSPLQTEKHGFEFGQELVVDPACVWDRYRALLGRAILVCGPGLLAVPADLGLRTTPDPRAKALRSGDTALLVVAARGQPVELVWVSVVSQSPGGQALIGEILFDTEHSDLHGLLRGQKVEFVRDCVVEANIGGGGV